MKWLFIAVYSSKTFKTGRGSVGTSRSAYSLSRQICIVSSRTFINNELTSKERLTPLLSLYALAAGSAVKGLGGTTSTVISLPYLPRGYNWVSVDWKQFLCVFFHKTVSSVVGKIVINAVTRLSKLQTFHVATQCSLREMTSEERLHKFHTDDTSLPRYGQSFWMDEAKFASNQKHYPDLGSDALWIERFHVTSQRPCWCSKTMKTLPCWCVPNQSCGSWTLFSCKTLSFVSTNLHRFQPCGGERSYGISAFVLAFRNAGCFLRLPSDTKKGDHHKFLGNCPPTPPLSRH